MVALVGIDRLNVLLTEARGAGCRLAWVEKGSLVLGERWGEARFAVDFTAEALQPVHGDGTVGLAAEPQAERGRDVRPSASEPAATPRWVDPGPVPGGRRTGHFALILEDQLIPARSQRELLRLALQAMERARPGTLDKLSAEKGRTKRPVARRRELLYEDAKLSRYAEFIEGGWWMATNNSFSEVEKFIRRAGFHAGLNVEIRRSP